MPSVAGLLVVGVLLSPPSRDDVRRAVADVYADARVQRTLPGADAPVETSEGDRERPRGGSYDREHREVVPPSTAARAVGGALLWGLVAAVAAVVVVAVARALADRRRAAARTPAVTAAGVAGASPAA